MASKRASTPPPPSTTMEGIPVLPSTPGPRTGAGGSDNFAIMGADRATVPASPGAKDQLFGPSTFANPPAPPESAIPLSRKRQKPGSASPTGAGIMKPQTKHLTGVAAARSLIAASKKKLPEMPFRFLDLPGEIRNMIYQHAHGSPRQALLVHRPRLASLRNRTRLDRSRPMASALKEQEQDNELATTGTTANSRHGKLKKKDASARDSNRPFVGLTQVCQLLRHEFRPIYLSKQEIGMDLTDVDTYINTFYAEASATIAALPPPGSRLNDAPFTGNLTIAVAEKSELKGKTTAGVEIYPLLDIWANSYKIEAGFGRYLKANYVPETDGEAKDLYRLFGRRVLRNRQCSSMNTLWRTILRTHSLSSVLIHRSPPPQPAVVPNYPINIIAGGPLLHTRFVSKPYIHIVFKKQCAEPWMKTFESVLPVNWLAEHGFGAMEYFEVKVGVEQ
ncbi:hypothetical protein ACN47E_004229 [Coniothyrium glycines]